MPAESYPTQQPPTEATFVDAEVASQEVPDPYGNFAPSGQPLGNNSLPNPAQPENNNQPAFPAESVHRPCDTQIKQQ